MASDSIAGQRAEGDSVPEDAKARYGHSLGWGGSTAMLKNSSGTRGRLSSFVWPRGSVKRAESNTVHCDPGLSGRLRCP